MIRRTRHTWAAGVGLAATMSGSAYALSLGQAELHSYIAQPLRLSVPISGEELNHFSPEDFEARILTAEEYADLGMLPPPIDLSNLSLKLNHAASGGFLLWIQSDSLVREPILQILLEVRHGQRSFIRQLDFLLDPPPAYQHAAEPTSLATNESQTSPRANTSSNRAAANQSQPTQDTLYGPVQFGETLSHIAARTRPQRSTPISQMANAILALNPHAFANGSPHALRSGVTLTIPGQLAKNESQTPARENTSSSQVAANQGQPAKAPKHDPVEAGETPSKIAALTPTQRSIPIKQMATKLDQPASQTKYGPVRSGETLSQIAARTRPQRSIPISQMAGAILSLNPHAFANGSPHSLRRGVTLTIPGQKMMASASYSVDWYSPHAQQINPIQVAAVQTETASAPKIEPTLALSLNTTSESQAPSTTPSATKPRLVQETAQQASLTSGSASSGQHLQASEPHMLKADWTLSMPPSAYAENQVAESAATNGNAQEQTTRQSDQSPPAASRFAFDALATAEAASTPAQLILPQVQNIRIAQPQQPDGKTYWSIGATFSLGLGLGLGLGLAALIAQRRPSLFRAK